MLIACDFDGVICRRDGTVKRKRNFITDPPVNGAAEALTWLYKNHDVYILTARKEEDFQNIKDWLLVNNFPDLEVTNVKKNKTKMIIDDRAVRFTNWQDMMKYFC